MAKQKGSNIELIMDQGIKMILYYRQHPCQAAYDLLGADLAPIQRPMFRDMWFKNFVMGICGRGGGKSIHIDSLCHIEDKGLVYLNEELPPVPPHLKDGEEEIIPWGQKIYTSKGFKPAKRLYLEKGIQGKQIRTQNGFINKGSNHHPLLTLDSDANFVYKSMDEFKVGDRVCIQRGQNVFGKNEIPVDDAYIIGLFIGDGAIGGKYPPSITTEDNVIKEFCIDYCIKNNISYRKNDDKRTENTSSIHFKKFDWFFEKYKVNRVLSYYKSVPYSIRTGTRETQIAFLQGYFDTDGTVDKSKGGPSCCSVSKKLLQEMQLMLLNFGIVGKIRRKKTKSKFGKAYLLDIYSNDALKFKELIGFRLERKQKLLDDYFDVKVLNPNKDTIPHIRDICWGIKQNYKKLNAKRYNDPELVQLLFYKACMKEVTYSRLHKFIFGINKILEKDHMIDDVYLRKIKPLENILKYNYYFDTITSIQDWTGDCYDFEMDMDEEPNYFANGFINHNTYLLGLIATLSCLLFPGFRAGLISGVFRQSLIIKSGTYDTFWTDEGLKSTAQEFYDSVEEGVTKTQSLESQNTILSKWRNPERACRSIKTTKGFELGGTVDHEILVLDEELNLVFKELQEITEDDNIVIKKGFKHFGDDDSMPTFDEFEFKTAAKDCKIPEKLTLSLAYWMGLLIGDGCLCVGKKHGKYCVIFVNEDQDLLDSFENHLIEYFVGGHENTMGKRNIKNNVWQIQYSGKKLIYYLLKCGFTKTTALDKKIPWIIKKASQGCIKGFLIGLLDTDGCVRVQLQKNGFKHCEVSFSTSSLQLAKEVQACFLNFGVVSNLGVSNKAGDRCLTGRTKKSKCAESYKVVITGIPNLNKFRDEIGFRCERKVNKLNDYLNSIGDKVIKADVVPNASNRVLSLCDECKDQIIRICWHKDILILRKIKHCTYNRNNITKNKIKKALLLAEKYNILTEDYYKLKKIIDLDLSFVKMKESKYFFAPTIDVEVENESCYWSNGMISHNSKMIFAEVEKLYAQSSIFREAAEKRPIRGTDTCYVRFKSVGGQPPSYIEALPLGTDGSKIRGSRFYLLLIDELAQIPTKIIDLVLRPMGSVALAPMERVRRLEQKNKLIRLGLASDRDFEDESVNKMIMTSSAFYKFNHMWKRMQDHWSQMDIAEKNGVESQYAVWQIPYWDLPEGFLDTTNIAEAKRIMSSAEFKMEYEAEMISDSEGFFKASLLEGCTNNSGFSIELKGKAADQYIVGIDPNQGGNASCGIVVIKVGAIKHIINALELKRLTTQDSTQVLQKLCDDYNVIRIFMDSRGGGNALRDLLEEGYGGVEPIIDRTNPEHKHVEGRHILEMVDFNSRWISDANFVTKALLEDKKLLFPEPPQTVSDLEGKRYENINMLKSQMLNIVVTQTGAGHLHFDTPRKMQNKDLYSAIILAAHGAREFEKEFEEETVVLYNSGGLIRERKPGATFNPITNQGPVVIKTDIGPAILKGKRRIK